MCRLFGFRSIISSQIHSSLVGADNALMLQSPRHPDGWGVAYYQKNTPHITHSLNSAIDCDLFKKMSEVVRSNTVLAHLRKATTGNIEFKNTHPFRCENWTFAHNGNLRSFTTVKDKIRSLISKRLQASINGDTDSELIFFSLLTNLAKLDPLLLNTSPSFMQLKKAVEETKSDLESIVGSFLDNDSGPPSDNYLTFILTNGDLMLAYQGGKKLFFSTHKAKCSESATCSFYNSSCESPTLQGKINHLIFSSEGLEGENIWNEMKFGDLIAVDKEMNIFKSIV